MAPVDHQLRWSMAWHLELEAAALLKDVWWDLHLASLLTHLLLPRWLLSIFLGTAKSLSFRSTSTPHHHTTTVLRPFFQDYPGEPVPEENFWTLWCKGILTEADTQTIWLGTTPSGLTSAHLHHPPFFTGRMPILPPNQQCQSTEGKHLCSAVIFISAAESDWYHRIVNRLSCRWCQMGRNTVSVSARTRTAGICSSMRCGRGA